MKYDILIPVGAGSVADNLELRIALRSIERYATGYNNIVIVGAIPSCINTKHPEIKVLDVVQDPKYNKEARIARNVYAAFEKLDITDNVAFWNDDYVLSKQMDVTRIPFFRKEETLRDSTMEKHEGYYIKCLKQTYHYLNNKGLHYYNYDIHYPILYNREKFLSLKESWDMSSGCMYGLVVKSTYCNQVLEEPGPVLQDIKLNMSDCSPATIYEKINTRTLWSYSDKAFLNGVGDFLRSAYPQKSRWETGYKIPH